MKDFDFEKWRSSYLSTSGLTPAEQVELSQHMTAEIAKSINPKKLKSRAKLSEKKPI